jgi:hypothetical protein
MGYFMTYRSVQINWLLKCRGLKLGKHDAGMGEITKAYMIMLRNLLRKGPL